MFKIISKSVLILILQILRASQIKNDNKNFFYTKDYFCHFWEKISVKLFE